MIDVFCDLGFEIIDRSKGSIGSDTVHEFYMYGLSIDISVKPENMHFKDSLGIVSFVARTNDFFTLYLFWMQFIFLKYACSKKDFFSYFDSTREGLIGKRNS
jgi:hypothetical protein